MAHVANSPAPHKLAERKLRTVARAETAQPEVSLPAPKSDAGEKKEAKPSPFAFFFRQKPAAEPDAPAAPDRAALIRLAIAPWGEIYVDGIRIGVSPPVNEVEVAPGDVLILATDGIRADFTEILPLAISAQSLAERILEGYATRKDDALVLVLHCNGDFR